MAGLAQPTAVAGIIRVLTTQDEGSTVYWVMVGLRGGYEATLSTYRISTQDPLAEALMADTIASLLTGAASMISLTLTRLASATPHFSQIGAAGDATDVPASQGAPTESGE